MWFAFFFSLHCTKKTIGLTSLHVTLLIGLKFRIKRYFPLVDEELLLVAAVDGSVVVGVVLALYPSRVHHIISPSDILRSFQQSPALGRMGGPWCIIQQFMETGEPIKKTGLSRTPLPRPPGHRRRGCRTPSTCPRRTSPAPPGQVTRGGLFNV